MWDLIQDPTFIISVIDHSATTHEIEMVNRKELINDAERILRCTVNLSELQFEPENEKAVWSKQLFNLILHKQW